MKCQMEAADQCRARGCRGPSKDARCRGENATPPGGGAVRRASARAVRGTRQVTGLPVNQAQRPIRTGCAEHVDSVDGEEKEW
jgi:hypothetical protein